MSLSAALRVFNTYILPSFRYNLPIWFVPGAPYVKKVDAVFTKFLKRYMRAPVFFNNGLTYFITKTQPLSLTLNDNLSQASQIINYPSSLSGFRPFHTFSHVTSEFFAARVVPSFIWTAPIPFYIPSSPSKRHEIFRKLVDCDVGLEFLSN